MERHHIQYQNDIFSADGDRHNPNTTPSDLIGTTSMRVSPNISRCRSRAFDLAGGATSNNSNNGTVDEKLARGMSDVLSRQGVFSQRCTAVSLPKGIIPDHRATESSRPNHG